MPFAYEGDQGPQPTGYANTTAAGDKGEMALLNWLKSEYSRMDIDYQKRSKAWSDWHKQFRGVMEKLNAEVTKSRLFINRTKVAVRSGLANILDVLYPGQDFYDVVGRSEIDQKGSETAKQVMDWVLNIGEYLAEAQTYVLQGAIYGTTFGKIVEREITDMVVDKVPVMHEILPIVTKYKTKTVKKTLRYPALETIDIWAMHIDPRATSIENASGLFHEIVRSLDYVEMMGQRGIYHNVAQVRTLSSKTHQNYTDKRRKNVGLPDQGLDNKESVHLYEYWGKVPSEIARGAGIEVKEGEFETECVITLANMDVIIRAERNTNPAQERMFIADVWEPSADNAIYGIGIPENVRGPQLALNATVNIRLDNKAWAIAAPLIVNIDKIEDIDDLVARPNWYIRVHGAPQDTAQFASIPDMTQGTAVEAEAFERYIDDESGMNKIVQASEGFGSNRTKGGIALAFSAASRPVRLIARGFENNLVAKALKKIFMLYVVDQDKDITIRVTKDPKSPQYLSVDPFSLALDVDFVPSGSFALTMRESTLESMMQFADAASKLPNVAMNLNWKYITEKIYQAMGLKDFDKVWLGHPSGAPGMMPPTPGASSGQTPEANPTPAGAAGAQGTPDIASLLTTLAGARR